MVIRVYGQPFEKEHEYEQFKEIRSLLKNEYEKSDKTIYVLFNFILSSVQIDVAVLTEEGPMIIELKDYTGVVTGKENGPWSVKTSTDELKLENVFLQLRRQKFALINKLKDLQKLGLLDIKEDKVLYNVKCCGYFNKGSTYDRNQISFNAQKWFSIITIEDLIDKISYAKSGYLLSPEDMHKITSAINLAQDRVLTRVESEKDKTLLWQKALEQYSYPVNLASYANNKDFPNYFTQNINGDRTSTRNFEDYFRKKAVFEIEVYFEVIFWKLFSQVTNSQSAYVRQNASQIAENMIKRMQERGSNSAEIFYKIDLFTKEPTLTNFKDFRELLGLRREKGSLALASTFPAFLDPVNYAILDSHVANWVNLNYLKHNLNRTSKLSKFSFNSEYGGKSILDDNFDSYMDWIRWCRETAILLRAKTNTSWRARDVEMAVFATKNSFELEVL